MIETSHRKQLPSEWSLFDDWVGIRAQNKVSPDWKSLNDLFIAYSDVVRNRLFELNELLADWDRSLAELGGDPTHSDWRQFRPLRLTREEDWSDWLAFLIETSDNGEFSHRLFGDSTSQQTDYARPVKVEREVTHSGYRADLIAQWSNGIFAHIEVKVGDSNLSKTFPTGRAMRARYSMPKKQWTNFILLLSHQVLGWEAVDHEETNEPPIEAITWEDVCIALRRGIRSEKNLVWKAWAYVFVGVIEQFLVGFPGYLPEARPVYNLESKIRILRGGLADG